MKIQRFSVPILFSFLLVGLGVSMKLQPVQAQQGPPDRIPPGLFSDEGAGTFDGPTFAPGITTRTKQETVVPAIPRTTTNEYVVVVIDILRELEQSNPNLANVLTDPTNEARNVVLSRLTEAGIPEASATQLIEDLEQVFQEIGKLSKEERQEVIEEIEGDVAEPEERNFRDDKELRVAQARRLVRAVTSFNELVKELEMAALQNPPEELLAIRSALFEASETTRVVDKSETEVEDNN